MGLLRAFQWYYTFLNSTNWLLHHNQIIRCTCLCLHLNLQDGSKSLCKGNPSSASANSLLKIRNVQRGPQKRIAWDNELLYIPKEGITEMLRSFMDQFLSGAYNSKFVSFPSNRTIMFCSCNLEITRFLSVLMQSVCDDIMDEHHSIEKSDIITFFKVARFVLAFQHEKVSNDQVWNRTHGLFILHSLMIYECFYVLSWRFLSHFTLCPTRMT